MTIAFTVISAVLVCYSLLRKFDMLSVGAICLVIYNYYGTVGYVWIASHEQAGVNYYSSYIDDRVYAIVVAQLVILAVAMVLYDAKAKKEAKTIQKYTESELNKVFTLAGLVSLGILLVNIARIGVSGLSANKAEVWAQTDVLYVTGLWLAMAVFTYALKTRQYGFLAISLPQVCVHLFIGSRAYFAVICIVAILVYSFRDSDRNIKRNLIVVGVGFLMLVMIMAYKQIYELVKIGDWVAVAATLQDPETYNWIFRWGEPRIVLANFNYIVESGITLSATETAQRLLSIIPFMDDLLGSGDRLMSSIIIGNLGSSYGLASNFWGECYAMGSYPCVFLFYVIWIAMLFAGNEMLKRKGWVACFLIPLFVYFAFYITRMDMTKVFGNIKMLVFAMLIWWVISSLITRKATVGPDRRLWRTGHVEVPMASASASEKPFDTSGTMRQKTGMKYVSSVDSSRRYGL